MSKNVLKDLRSRVLSGEKGDKRDNLVTTIYYIMKTFKLTIVEMSKMPISTFNILANEIDKENKEKAKQTKSKPMRKSRLRRK